MGKNNDDDCSTLHAQFHHHTCSLFCTVPSFILRTLNGQSTSCGELRGEMGGLCAADRVVHVHCALISTLGLASSFFSLPFLPGPKNITTAGFWEVQKSLGRGRLKGTKNGNCTWVLGKRPEKCIRVPGHKNGN